MIPLDTPELFHHLWGSRPITWSFSDRGSLLLDPIGSSIFLQKVTGSSTGNHEKVHTKILLKAFEHFAALSWLMQFLVVMWGCKNVWASSEQCELHHGWRIWSSKIGNQNKRPSKTDMLTEIPAFKSRVESWVLFSPAKKNNLLKF